MDDNNSIFDDFFTDTGMEAKEPDDAELKDDDTADEMLNIIGEGLDSDMPQFFESLTVDPKITMNQMSAVDELDFEFHTVDSEGEGTVETFIFNSPIEDSSLFASEDILDSILRNDLSDC